MSGIVFPIVFGGGKGNAGGGGSVVSIEKDPYTNIIEIGSALQHSPLYTVPTPGTTINIIKGTGDFTGGVYTVPLVFDNHTLSFTGDFVLFGEIYENLTGTYIFKYELLSTGKMLVIGLNEAGDLPLLNPPVLSNPIVDSDTEVTVTVTDNNLTPNEVNTQMFYRETGQTTWISNGFAPQDSASYQYSGLSANTQYDFSAIAKGDGTTVNDSPRSNTVQATTNTQDFPVIQSATVENDSKTDLIVVFDESVNIIDTTGLSLNFTTGIAKTLTGAAFGTGTGSLTFTISADIEEGDVFTLEVTGSNNITAVDNGASLQPVSQPVINNVQAIIALDGLYTFNNSLNDDSGNNRNGVAAGTVTFVNDRNGNPNSAIYLAGTAGQPSPNNVLLGALGDFDLGVNGISIAMWIKSIDNVTSTGTFIDYGNAVPKMSIINAPAGVGNISVTSLGFGSTPRINSGVTSADYHFVVLQVTSAKLATLYVDDMATPTNANVDITGADLNGQLGIGQVTTINGFNVDACYIKKDLLSEADRNILKNYD